MQWFSGRVLCSRRTAPENLPIYIPNRLAPFRQRVTKCFRALKSATDGNAIIRCRIIRQHGFAFITPPAQDAFHTPESPIILHQFPRLRQSISLPGTFERAHGISLLPTVLEAKGLRHELRVH